MLGEGWLTLRQAREAMRSGRLDDAQRLLSLPAAQSHRRCHRLLARLAQRYVARGEQHLRNQEPELAWQDLLHAERLRVEPVISERLRNSLTRRAIEEIRRLLSAGEPGRASEFISRIRSRNVEAGELTPMEDLAREWLTAREQADRGEFGSAMDTMKRLSTLHGDVAALQTFHEELVNRHRKFVAQLPVLHTAVEAGRWREVLVAAEEALLAAPQHVEVRRARSRAWKAIEPPTVALHRPDYGNEASRAPSDSDLLRFLLWIDGVGGYLVCLGTRLTFGQAAAGDRVDVPLLADVSRLHASLTRDPEGYVLEAVRPVQVNTQTITRTILRPDDRVTLGASCQFLFRLPVPVSATARLDLVSGHRVPLGVDGVLLMAETLVLGDGSQVHVPVPDLPAPVVLYRGKEGLALRHDGGLRINGQPFQERGPVPMPARIEYGDASLAIEPL